MSKQIKFINCKIDLSKKVFTPRIETEFWVGKAIAEIKKQKTKNKKQKILDIFAGTGCIGIAILMACPESCRRIDFADIDDAARKQIKINLELNNISKERYKIYKSNLFEKLKGERYNFVFANPPYVALDRISEVQEEVLEKEPHISLFAGKDGMDCIRNFFIQVKEFLQPNGKIFLEFDPFQKKKIKEILEKEKFKFVLMRDQFGKFRWLRASSAGLKPKNEPGSKSNCFFKKSW